MSSLSNDAPQEDPQWQAIESPSFRFGSAPSSVIGPLPGSLFPTNSIVQPSRDNSDPLEPNTDKMESSPPTVQSDALPGTASLPASEVGFTQLVDALCEDSSQRSQQEANPQNLAHSLSTTSLPGSNSLRRDDTTILEVPPLRNTVESAKETRTVDFQPKSSFSGASWKLPSPVDSSTSSSMHSSDDEGDDDEKSHQEAQMAEQAELPILPSPKPDSPPTSPLPVSDNDMMVDSSNDAPGKPSNSDEDSDSKEKEKIETSPLLAVEDPLSPPPSPKLPPIAMDIDPHLDLVEKEESSDSHDENSSSSDTDYGSSQNSSGSTSQSRSSSSYTSGVRSMQAREEANEISENDDSEDSSSSESHVPSSTDAPLVREAGEAEESSGSGSSSEDESENVPSAPKLARRRSSLEIPPIDEEAGADEHSSGSSSDSESNEGVKSPRMENSIDSAEESDSESVEKAHPKRSDGKKRSSTLLATPTTKPSRTNSQLIRPTLPATEERKLHSFKPIRSDGTGLPPVKNTSPLQKFELPPLKPSPFPTIDITSPDEKPTTEKSYSKRTQAKKAKATSAMEIDSESEPASALKEYDATFVPSTLSFGSFGSQSSLAKLNGPSKTNTRRRRNTNQVSLAKLIEAKMLNVGDYLLLRGQRALVKQLGWLEADLKTSLPEVSDWARWVLQKLGQYVESEDTGEESQYWPEIQVIHIDPFTKQEIFQRRGSDTLDQYAARWHRGITDDIPKSPVKQRMLIERPSAPAKASAPKQPAKAAPLTSSNPESPRPSNEMDVDDHDNASNDPSSPEPPSKPFSATNTSFGASSSTSDVNQLKKRKKFDFASLIEPDSDDEDVLSAFSFPIAKRPKLVTSVAPTSNEPLYVSKYLPQKAVAAPEVVPAKAAPTRVPKKSAPVVPAPKAPKPAQTITVPIKLPEPTASVPKSAAKKTAKLSVAAKRAALKVPPPTVEIDDSVESPRKEESPPKAGAKKVAKTSAAKATRAAVAKAAKASAAAHTAHPESHAAHSAHHTAPHASHAAPHAPSHSTSRSAHQSTAPAPAPVPEAQPQHVVPKVSPKSSAATRAKAAAGAAKASTKATSAASASAASREPIVGPVMMSSGLSALMSKSLAVAIGKLGGKLTQTVTDQVTHLVVHVDENGLASRTFKYLEAMVRGVEIVSMDWVVQSLTAGKYLPSKKFIVSGDSCFEGGPAQAIAGKRANVKQRRNLIFKDKNVFLNGNFNGANQLQLAQLQHLLQLGGAEAPQIGGSTGVEPYVALEGHKDAIVICDEATDQDVALVLCLQTNASLITPLWILDSISHCECVGIDSYLIVEKPSEEDGLNASQSW